MIRADAQTSGGLLIAVAPANADRLVDELARRGVTGASVIGRFIEIGTGRIKI